MVPAGQRNNPLEHIAEFEQVGPRPTRRPFLVSGAGVLLLLAFQGWLLGRWTRAEDRPPSWDQAIHLEIAHDYSTLLAKGDLGGLLHLGPKPGMPPFPPLYELTLVPWLGRPDAVQATLWANFGWLAALVVCVWGLGLVYAGPWEALAAAVLVACAPQAQWLLHNHLSDLALAAWIAAAYLACAWSAGLSRWRPALLVGAAVAGAMLTKWSAWTYLLPMAFLWGRAVFSPLGRRGALAALGVGVLLCAPWYAAQLPVLLPRLVDATADQAVPVWRGWAVFSYLRILIGGLDAPFWALALVGAVAPRLRRGRDDNWLIVAWLWSSAIFWTIVPNRQMRFLFPAVAPLALFVPGVFPRAAAVLCVWQLASAANYTFGWVKPYVSFGPGLTLLQSDPPAREGWRISEILRAADSRRDDGLPFSNVTLLANDSRFNGPAFNWELKRQGITGLRIRGVNSRYCELSEFVVIKGGSLGPKSVVNQLPEVRDSMLADGSWFRAGYEDVGRFPLADGSEAILYRRRRRAAPPWNQPVLKVASLETPQFSAKDVVLRLGRWDAKAGAYDRVELSASALVVRGVEISDVKARLEGSDILPIRGPAGLADVRLLRLKRLTIDSAQVTAEALAGLIRRRAPALAAPAVRLEDTVSVFARLKGHLDVSAEARLTLDERALRARLVRARFGPLPLPASLVDVRVSLEPTAELPFELLLAGLRIRGGSLSIP